MQKLKVKINFYASDENSHLRKIEKFTKLVIDY